MAEISRTIDTTGQAGCAYILYYGGICSKPTATTTPITLICRLTRGQLMAKILYIEHHPARREILAETLRSDDFGVAVARDGVEGVEKAISWLPDIILMGLHRMDGFEVVAALRDTPKTADIPIIVISAWQEKHKRIRAYQAGVDHYFTKPIELANLIREINNLLPTNREERELHRHKKELILDILKNGARRRDLSGIDLRGASLQGVILSKSNLSGADLSGARLNWASLDGVDLSESNLREVDLHKASLGEADLSGADLREANLSGAKFLNEITYDNDTIWPDGFDPEEAGAKLVE